MKDQNSQLQSLLKLLFGYDSFRPEQERIVRQLLQGRDLLAVLPTGAGKSICFQLPACLLNGVTLVVSPLLSLMSDQLQALKKKQIPAERLDSTRSAGHCRSILKQAAFGTYKLLYVTPERLQSPSFVELAQKLRISMLVIDEAHCVSQWGQNFRPQYLKIYDFIQLLPRRPTVAAFTATATPRIQKDIIELLGLKKPFCCIAGFDRPNLSLSVVRNPKKETQLCKLLKEQRQASAIIYCATRRKTEELCAFLRKKGFPATRYHAGLSNQERRRNQSDFLENRIPIIVATNALGMGIDKPDIRLVVHYQMPKSLEQYYQEVGRAGRDGKPAQCVLLYSEDDIAICRYFIEHSDYHARNPEEVWKRKNWDYENLNQMILYATSLSCLRQRLLGYFGEESAPCHNCSCCTALEQFDYSQLKEIPLYQDFRTFRRGCWKRHPLSVRPLYRKRTLFLLCSQLPKSREQLLKIPGFTLKEWETIGKPIIEIIKKREKGEIRL